MLPFIKAALQSGGRVLVHCHQGVSRSGALAIAYVMADTGVAFDEAKQLVRAVRGIINPNGMFECQLKAWQVSQAMLQKAPRQRGMTPQLVALPTTASCWLCAG